MAQLLKQKFPDVTPDKWYYSEIQRAVFYGLLVGREDGTFDPNSYMTRAETGATLTRIFERIMFITLLTNGVVLSSVLFSKRE